MVGFADDGSTVSSAGARHDPDDISLVLRQILRRSSSSQPLPPPPLATSSAEPLVLPSMGMEAHAEDQHLLCFSSMSIPTMYPQIAPRPAVFSCSDRLSVDRIPDETLSGVVLSSSTIRGGSNLSSESLTGSIQMTNLDREYAEECDYGNEEVRETAVEEPDTKQHPPRSQSKRSRAAEVHNLSEKRRRSRINEKMKALQNLIPNSNKTDKASMLDEAIEYLKQLQLQVQMLSIRNGLSLHAMCLPGVPEILHPTQLSQMGRDLGNRGGSLDVNMANALNTTPNASNTMLSLPASPGRAAFPGVSTIINSEATSFGLESCVLPNFSSFELHDQAICRDQRVHQDHHNVNNTEMKAQAFLTGYMQQLLVPKMPSSS